MHKCTRSARVDVPNVTPVMFCRYFHNH